MRGFLRLFTLDLFKRLSIPGHGFTTTGGGYDYIRKVGSALLTTQTPSLPLPSGLSSLFHAYDAHDNYPRPILLLSLFYDLSHV